MAGYGQIRLEMPKERAQPPFYFRKGGFVENCKYFAIRWFKYINKSCSKRLHKRRVS